MELDIFYIAFGMEIFLIRHADSRPGTHKYD